jgi:hypothetical protein
MKEYIYIHPTSSCGMCGYIWQVIRAMYHFPNDKYYIQLGKECMFFDDSIEHTKNAWEYYFEQPHINVLPPSENIIKEVGLLHDAFSEFRDCYMKNSTKDQLQNRRIEYSKIIEKNVILKSSIKEKIDSFYDTHFKGKKVLGVHCRSTDHPDKLNISDCANMIDSLSNQHDLIFASSDDAHQIYQLKDIFGDKLVTYDSLRSTDGNALHHQHNQRIVGKDNYNYKIGEDVIVESYLLSKTNFLFCTTNSNVNYLVRSINPHLPYIVINHYYPV